MTITDIGTSVEVDVPSETTTKGPKMTATDKKSASKNSKDAYNANGKTNLLLFDPDKLVIVSDETSALYDKRHDMELDEHMILNVMELGILEPVLIRKNQENGDVEVVAGRQRVRWAREANKRLAKQGLPTLEVPAIVKRGKDDLLFSIRVSENEIRTADTPSVRAEKMQKLLDMGKDDEYIGKMFGCSKTTVKNTLAILECCAAVRKAGDAGRINVTTMYGLSKLEVDEQKSKLEEILATAGSDAKPRKKSKKIRDIVRGDKGDKPTKMLRALGEVTSMRKSIEASKSIEEDARDVALATLDWVLGKETINKFMAKTIVVKD